MDSDFAIQHGNKPKIPSKNKPTFMLVSVACLEIKAVGGISRYPLMKWQISL